MTETTAVSREQSTTGLEYLAQHRRLLGEFCSLHASGLIPFYSEKAGVFSLHPGEEVKEFRHITSTATCFASMELCPEAQDRLIGGFDFRSLAATFAKTAIEQDIDNKWRSDGAAQVYCTCRGLPFVLSKLEKWHPNIGRHLRRIAHQLNEQGSRFAIGEAAPPSKTEETEDQKKQRIEGWYQPNAFHTFWTLAVLDQLNHQRFSAGADECEDFQFLRGRIPLFRLWARQQLGTQVALHSVKSSKLDSDQLAWSLAILVREPTEYQSDLATQDIIRESLKCLFGTQEPVGTWRHYAPLFHYPSSGNAYCYTFETFAALLEQVLRPEAEFLRKALTEHAEGLLRLWRYADSTKAKLPIPEPAAGGKSYGWSSGHRGRPQTESWATASVFSYTQMLRRLVGVWTCEEALAGLNHKRSTRSREEALKKLDERSRTWTRPDLPDTLASMFINPISAVENESSIDPDRFLIGDKAARSVILFGPPGTGKTTLVSGVADAIGWKYIELHPSHFVSEGLPNVQHTADGIFGRLMEVDHAVILFDEIDELVRDRESEPDQFGRFLTTSMLPRLAELWKARKVIYFVATNHIEFFDRAITRSERFDAVMFLSPPTFDAKQREVLRILQEEYSMPSKFDPTLTRDLIESRLPTEPCLAEQGSKKAAKKATALPLPPDNVLSKFALVRFDELSEIALTLASLLDQKKDKVITADVLSECLQKLSDRKVRTLGEYCRFISDPGRYERFDASRFGLWRVSTTVGLDADSVKLLQTIGNQSFVRAPIGDHTNIRVPGYEATLCSFQEAGQKLGTIKLEKKA